MAACSFQARFDETHYKCGATGACPSGFTCVARLCVQPPDPDAGTDGALADAEPVTATDASVDASIGGAADATVDGGVVARFTDDFGDGVLDGWSPWTHPGCSVSETGGFLQLDYGSNSQAYCGADTNQLFDLRTGSVVVHVLAPSLDGFEAYVVLFSASSQQQIQMIRDVGTLTMQLQISGVVTGQATVADDGTASYWRIREQGSTTIWETSPDGAAWTLRHSTTKAVDASSMHVELAAGTFPPSPSTTVRARFDQVTVF